MIQRIFKLLEEPFIKFLVLAINLTVYFFSATFYYDVIGIAAFEIMVLPALVVSYYFGFVGASLFILFAFYLNTWILVMSGSFEIYKLVLGILSAFVLFLFAYLVNRMKQQHGQLLDHVQDKHTIIGIVAHDIRNPLTTILESTKMLESDHIKNKEDVKTLYGIIGRSSLKIKQMIQELLQSHRVESLRFLLKKEPISIKAFLESRIHVFEYSALQKKIKIKLKLGDAKHANMSCDKEKMEHVLDNLLSNAIKYSPMGGEVCVKCDLYSNQVKIEIEDNGKGIPEGEIKLLFKPFSKTSTVPTNNEESVGLGLYICKQIIDLHEGEIGVYRNSKGGSTFYFSLKNC